MNRLSLILGFIVIFSTILLTSCSPKIYKSLTNNYIIYPSPPETARIQYLKSYSTSADITPKKSAFVKSVVGEEKETSIIKPYGLFLRNGKIYVCDVALGGGLEIIDLEKEKLSYFFPQGEHKLKLPLNCYVDEENNLYVVDISLQKVIVYNQDGSYKTTFGKKESIKPTDVFIANNKIWVVDFGNNRVNIFNKQTFEYEDYFPKLENGEEGFLYKPTNLFITKNKIYVSYMGHGNVKVYTLTGDYVQTIGQYGNTIGSFVRPKGIAVDKEENLYVVDASFENVQIFNEKGQLLLFFGGHYVNKGDMWLPTKVTIDYDNLKYFKKYVDPKYNLKYLIIVANQYGPEKISVYGRVEPK